MKEKFMNGSMAKGAKWTFTGMSVVEIILGLCLIIWPSSGSAIIGYVLGGLLCAYGAFNIIAFILHPILLAFGISLFSGVAAIIFGALILSFPNVVVGMIAILLGIIIIFGGLAISTYSVIAAALSIPGWWISLLISFAFDIVGIIVLFNPGSTSNVLMIIIGVVLILEAVMNFALLYKVGQFKKSLAPDGRDLDEPIDVEFTDVDD